MVQTVFRFLKKSAPSEGTHASDIKRIKRYVESTETKSLVEDDDSHLHLPLLHIVLLNVRAQELWKVFLVGGPFTI